MGFRRRQQGYGAVLLYPGFSGIIEAPVDGTLVQVQILIDHTGTHWKTQWFSDWRPLTRGSTPDNIRLRVEDGPIYVIGQIGMAQGGRIQLLTFEPYLDPDQTEGLPTTPMA